LISRLKFEINPGSIDVEHRAPPDLFWIATGVLGCIGRDARHLPFAVATIG
jgi:hypothetical protein